MEDKKCPLTGNNCLKTDCAWYIIKTETTAGQIDINVCAVRLLAITKHDEVERSK